MKFARKFMKKKVVIHNSFDYTNGMNVEIETVRSCSALTGLVAIVNIFDNSEIENGRQIEVKFEPVPLLVEDVVYDDPSDTLQVIMENRRRFQHKASGAYFIVYNINDNYHYQRMENKGCLTIINSQNMRNWLATQ